MNPPRFRRLCCCAGSESLIGRERDAVQLAVLRIEVAHGVVLGGAVVPHSQGVGLPAQAGLDFGHGDQHIQLGQQRVALHTRQAFDVAGECGVHVQNLFAGDGMHAHHGVFHRRVFGAGLGQLLAAAVFAQQVFGPAADLPGVHGGECFQVGLELGRQLLIGGGQARPDGVAAAGRDDLRIQAGAHGWVVAPGDVGVPVVGSAGALGGAFHNLDFGLAVHTRKEGFDLIHMAKGAGELHLLLWRELLVTKEDDFVLGQRVLQFGLGHIAQGLGQVQAVNGRTDVGGVGLGGKAFVNQRQVVEFGHLVFLS